MIEIQGDAGGHRFVAPLKATGAVTSCSAQVKAGDEFTATHRVKVEAEVEGTKVTVDATRPLTVNQATLQSFMIHVSNPTLVSIGNAPFTIDPGAPLMWFKEWEPAIQCPIPAADAPQEITCTPESDTSITIVLVH